MVNRVVLNETSYFGRGARSKLGVELRERNYNKVLLVTDFNLMNSSVTKKVIDVLEENGITYFVFLHIKPNPTIKNVQDGVMLGQISNVDAIVAVGGGSVIDTAKAISIIMTNPEHSSVTSLEGKINTHNKGLPVFALPTTSGTSSEVTISYDITDEKNTKKMICIDTHDIPVCAIVDPELMQEMPQRLAATSGMTALTNAIEGYLAKDGWLIPDIFLINAISLIYKNLDSAVNKKDESAIDKIAYAQYVAGMGFSNVGLGITNSMSHSLSAFFDMPQGLANSILLPHVLKYNGKSCPELFVNIGNAMELEVDNLSDDEVIDEVVRAIQKLSNKLEIAQTLSEIRIPRDLIPQLAEKAYHDICTESNPRDITIEDIINIYLQAY